MSGGIKAIIMFRAENGEFQPMNCWIDNEFVLLNDPQLKEMLAAAIEEENYERAAKTKEQIDIRNKPYEIPLFY